MKVSFVIPAHNEELRLGACLDATRAEITRSGIDAEVIVVNNASTDATGAVALAHPGVVLIDESRKGLPRARQSGFEASSGDLIANIDADTLPHAGWLDTVVRAFEQDPKLVALSGPFIYFDLPWYRRVFVHIFFYFAYLTYLFNRFVVNAGSMLQGGNFVIRREALEQIGGFDPSIDFYGEDTDVAQRLHKIGKVRWTFALPMRASGRRLAHEGMVRIGVRYGINYFWMTVAKKPWSTDYIDVRTDWQGR